MSWAAQLRPVRPTALEKNVDLIRPEHACRRSRLRATDLAVSGLDSPVYRFRQHPTHLADGAADANLASALDIDGLSLMPKCIDNIKQYSELTVLFNFLPIPTKNRR